MSISKFGSIFSQNTSRICVYSGVADPDSDPGVPDPYFEIGRIRCPFY